MHYVYLIYSDKTAKFYIGETANLRRRFTEHNEAKSISTKAGVPWKLIYYEAYQSKQAAKQRERSLKHHGKSFAMLKKRIGFDS